MTIYRSQSIDGCLSSIFFRKKKGSKNNTGIFMFVCTMILYEYMNSPRNDVFNLFVNVHVRIKIYREFYQCMIYIPNEGRHVRILYKTFFYPFGDRKGFPIKNSQQLSISDFLYIYIKKQVKHPHVFF
jgi:hypothetical protein